MKNTIATIGLISILLITNSTFSCADADESFVTVEGAVNLTFVESIAKNRAHKGEEKSAKYMKINGNDDFKEAIKNDQFNTDIGDGSRIQKQYIYRDIQNVDLTDRDLTGISGDTLDLGSNTDGGNIVQSLNIENSTIKTDKYINAGVTSSSDDVSDITSITDIDNSELSGGNAGEDDRISTSKYFD
jgi:hypothetical protein